MRNRKSLSMVRSSFITKDNIAHVMKFCKNSAPRLSEGRLLVPSEYADDKALADIARSQRRAQFPGVGGGRGHCDLPRGPGPPWHAFHYRCVRDSREAVAQ